MHADVCWPEDGGPVQQPCLSVSGKAWSGSALPLGLHPPKTLSQVCSISTVMTSIFDGFWRSRPLDLGICSQMQNCRPDTCGAVAQATSCDTSALLAKNCPSSSNLYSHKMALQPHARLRQTFNSSCGTVACAFHFHSPAVHPLFCSATLQCACIYRKACL